MDLKGRLFDTRNSKSSGFTSEKCKTSRSVFVEATSSASRMGHLVFAIAISVPIETDIVTSSRPVFAISSSITLDMRI